MQIIILVETKSVSGSDCMYIKSFINNFYNGLRGHKITYIPMNGKTNYLKKEKEIQNYINKYSGDSKVMITIDIDSPDLIFDQNVLNKKIINYCTDNDFEFVWFNKTIEHVFIKKIVKKNKNEIALNYIRRKKHDININDFNEEKFINTNVMKSNLNVVLNKLIN